MTKIVLYKLIKILYSREDKRVDKDSFIKQKYS